MGAGRKHGNKQAVNISIPLALYDALTSDPDLKGQWSKIAEVALWAAVNDNGFREELREVLAENDRLFTLVNDIRKLVNN